MISIQEKNNQIEKSIHDKADKLLREDQVDAVIGYSKGTIPMRSCPVVIRNEKDVDALIWNNFCSINLAKYLAPYIPTLKDEEGKNLRVGIISKGCVGRALIHLAAENQIDLENITIIGIPCNGIINRSRILKEFGVEEILKTSIVENELILKGKSFEKKLPIEEYLNELCKKCKVKSPPSLSSLSEICVGELQDISTIEDDFADISEFESKTTEERWAHIEDLLSSCIRCYACREICPMCYCQLCFVDQKLPRWFGKTTELTEIILYHLVRATHLTGRCVACGACSSVCPMGIDLHLITRKLEHIVKDRFDFTSGLDPETPPPMHQFKMDDKQEFMLEEE
ncbi:MAG: 4Fe-4S ferredoxin [Promethearchaeota archaeon]|nr:MAG: 4Fe-4S ferredoxin [Candidatus Lokiarchaeota archaeon]